jgi:hypothetical protein
MQRLVLARAAHKLNDLELWCMEETLSEFEALAKKGVEIAPSCPRPPLRTEPACDLRNYVTDASFSVEELAKWLRLQRKMELYRNVIRIATSDMASFGKSLQYSARKFCAKSGCGDSVKKSCGALFSPLQRLPDLLDLGTQPCIWKSLT